MTLISDWPIIAHPPIRANTPHTTLATPWRTHSRLPWPRVSVISSMSVIVIIDSMRPTPASTSANRRMMRSVWRFRGWDEVLDEERPR